jgi:hypothetical protein
MWTLIGISAAVLATAQSSSCERTSKIASRISSNGEPVRFKLGMALTLRRTNLETSPAYEHLGDFSVFEDGTAIGRIYEQRPPAAPDGAWFWSILGVGRRSWGHVKTDGRAATFEDAKTAFAANWQAFEAIGRDSDSVPG